MNKLDEIEKQVGEAIKLFWRTRNRQSKAQGLKSGVKDAGLRAAVTGGKHLDGFTDYLPEIGHASRRAGSSGVLARSQRIARLLLKGEFHSPNDELAFRNFATGL